MAEPFAELFKESEIFAYREVLSPHYVPDKLLFRDRQINEIEKALTPSLRGERGRNVFIYGKTGTGKTSSIKYVVERVRLLPVVKAKITYVNCRIYNSRYRVLSKIASDHIPMYAKRGLGIIDIYEKIISWMEEDNKILIVVLDELDIIRDLDDLVYTLTRANSDIKSGGITIIGVSNKLSFKEELDPRSLSTLYENEIAFPPYNSSELSAILNDRVVKGFRPGVVDQASINLASAIAAKESGDARLALKIITKAGEIAENRGGKSITVNDVGDAARIAEEEIAYEVIGTLPEHQRLIVYAIAVMSLTGGRYKKLDKQDDAFLLSGEIYDRYVSITQSLHKETKGARLYRRYVTDLQMQGIVTSYESGKGVRGHTRLVKLMYQPEKIKEMIEKSLFNTQPDEQNSGAESRPLHTDTTDAEGFQ
ncbi:MAG: AAA family ATPase [Candidatus Marsarchaeota archaeon]|nr:AAA family ATPase [Candidatus Marsarchaeota archaeon]